MNTMVFPIRKHNERRRAGAASSWAADMTAPARWPLRIRAVLLLLVSLFPPVVHTRASSPAEDRRAIELLFRQYGKAISDESLAGLKGLIDADPAVYEDRLKEQWASAFTQYKELQMNYALTLLGVHGDTALVRQSYVLAGRLGRVNSSKPRINLGRGTYDFLLRRKGEGFLFTGDQWLEVNIVQELQEAMDQVGTSASPQMLQMVMEVRGGLWYPLRRTRWTGSMVGASLSARVGEEDLLSTLQSVMQTQSDRNEPGNVHLFLQWDGKRWFLASALWHSLRAGDVDAAGSSLELEVRQSQKAVEQQFGDPNPHREYAQVLARRGLHAQALEELQKANGLEPDIISDHEMKMAVARSELDPQKQSQRQAVFEIGVGVAPDHPRLVLQQSVEKFGFDYKDPEVAFERAWAYAQLGDYATAYREWDEAKRMSANRPSASQRQVLSIMSANIERRLQAAKLKPQDMLRSDLFTVWFRAGDPALESLLISIERAEHVVYSNFGIPMGQTEIVLFPTQAEFKSYSEQTATAKVSESTAAYTNGQEIVTFAQEGSDTLSVVAHEYGHVAVQKMTSYREVPTWINEGIACCVQGGYWDYQKRCQDAARTNQLMTIGELLEWKVAGEKAYIAYSQANAMIQYLLDKFGKETLLNILSDLGRGLDANAAFRRNLGVDQTGLLIQWVSDAFSKNMQ